MKRMILAGLAVSAACGGGTSHPDAHVAPIDGPGDAPQDVFAPPFDVAPMADARPTEICTNGLDDDVDGHVDCADSDCSATAYCTPAPHTIQELQDGTVATGKRASVDKVFVTAVRVTGAGAVIAFLQEPDGVTSGGHVYPAYAGVQLFVSGSEATGLPGIAAIHVGDCISLTGTVIEFAGDTELLTPTAFTAEAAGSCGAMPGPLVIAAGSVPFEAIATDADPTTMGDQLGVSSEIYEGVLVRVTGVAALTAPDMALLVPIRETAGTGATLLVGPFLYQPGLPATAGQTYSSITGIYAQRPRFQLLPRSPADIVP